MKNIGMVYISNTVASNLNSFFCKSSGTHYVFIKRFDEDVYDVYEKDTGRKSIVTNFTKEEISKSMFSFYILKKSNVVMY